MSKPVYINEDYLSSRETQSETSMLIHYQVRFMSILIFTDYVSTWSEFKSFVISVKNLVKKEILKNKN